MRILLFGKKFDHYYDTVFCDIVAELLKNGADISIFESFEADIKHLLPAEKSLKNVSSGADIDADIILSFGGDGTLLDTVPLVGDSGIPVMGINTGHLGFLSATSAEDALDTIDEITRGRFSIQKRAMIRLESPNSVFGNINYGLNEIAVQRRDTGSLITITVSVDDTQLATYRGDGLIVATATGSTAYSLSAGGPIVTPETNSFIITPIAAHNLTLRPVVIPDDSIVSIHVESRQNAFALSLDSRITNIDAPQKLVIRRNDFDFNMAVPENSHFFDTIRKKLLWGEDVRTR